jgi:hypothetical protein
MNGPSDNTSPSRHSACRSASAMPGPSSSNFGTRPRQRAQTMVQPEDMDRREMWPI